MAAKTGKLSANRARKEQFLRRDFGDLEVQVGDVTSPIVVLGITDFGNDWGRGSPASCRLIVVVMQSPPQWGWVVMAGQISRGARPNGPPIAFLLVRFFRRSCSLYSSWAQLEFKFQWFSTFYDPSSRVSIQSVRENRLCLKQLVGYCFPALLTRRKRLLSLEYRLPSGSC